MLVGLVSAKGSPGVTTAALALGSQWPRRALVLEADPFGGDVRAGLAGGSWPATAGIADAVADLRTAGMDETLRRRVHRPAPHAPAVLAGVGSVGQASTVPWGQIGASLGRLRGADTIADCGRFALADGVAPLLSNCDVLVLVTGSTLRAARSTSRIAPRLRDELGVSPDDGRVSVLVVGPGEPYTTAEVASGCDVPGLGELPRDPRAAAVWSDGARPDRSFDRSPLQRAAQSLAGRLFRAHRTSDGVA